MSGERDCLVFVLRVTPSQGVVKHIFLGGFRCSSDVLPPQDLQLPGGARLRVWGRWEADSEPYVQYDGRMLGIGLGSQRSSKVSREEPRCVGQILAGHMNIPLHSVAIRGSLHPYYRDHGAILALLVSESTAQRLWNLCLAPIVPDLCKPDLVQRLLARGMRAFVLSDGRYITLTNVSNGKRRRKKTPERWRVN